MFLFYFFVFLPMNPTIGQPQYCLFVPSFDPVSNAYVTFNYLSFQCVNVGCVPKKVRTIILVLKVSISCLFSYVVFLTQKYILYSVFS